MNAADLAGCQQDVFRPFRSKKIAHGRLVRQIEFRMGAGDDIAVALFEQAPEQRRTGQAAMSGHINSAVFSSINGLLVVIFRIEPDTKPSEVSTRTCWPAMVYVQAASCPFSGLSP